MSKAERKKLRDKFLLWQCRLRQIAMREDGGRPAPGMCPRVLDASGAELAPRIIVLILPKAPAESTAFFRFQLMKSPDPRERYEKALHYLQADYFQEPEGFSDVMVATLSHDAPLATQILTAKRCTLVFAQGRHGYRVPCKAKALKEDDAAREAAIWHNRVFNPALPDAVHVVAFEPDWASARAEHGREETMSP
ncbi:MAG: hypothetical protein ACRECX_12715 [Methyloceanibacter sp.]|uniref:hypothetical protein n=1 Tax=Methyloceanibacter sp. TaxID=1965321 RepID=UPI003D6C91EC